MSIDCRRLRHVAVSLAAALLALLLVGPGAAVANKKGEHCVHPDGRDLNAFYAVSERIVAPFCAQLRAGEHWRPAGAWLMASSFDKVPAGFQPAGATPLDDFHAKLVSVRYVVDPGTPQERSYTFTDTEKLWTGKLAGLPAINVVTLGALHPLSTGQHVYRQYWKFSAMHCDGLAANAQENCLPAGETAMYGAKFEVIPASQ